MGKKIILGDKVVDTDSIIGIKEGKVKLPIVTKTKNSNTGFKKFMFGSTDTHTTYKEFTFIKITTDVEWYLTKENFTIYNDEEFLIGAKEVKRRYAEGKDEFKTLQSIGFENTIGGWAIPDYLDTHVQYDKDIKCREDFIKKYMSNIG